MTPKELADYIVQIPELLISLSSDPKTQMEMLFPLCEYQVQIRESNAPLAQVENRTIRATTALCRRVALATLCKIAVNWQANNWDEVMAVKQRIAELLNDEIIIAIDQQDMEVAETMKSIRTQLLQLHTNAAGELPHLRTVTRTTALPALLVCQQLYTDGSRADELVQRCNPLHPAFMPMEMEVLGS